MSMAWTLTAQKSAENYNYRGFKEQNYYFGFNIGLNNSGYVAQQSRFFIGNEELRIAEPVSGVGFNLNLIANIKLGYDFDFRFTPGFSYIDRKLEYTKVSSDEVVNGGRDAFYVEVPLTIRYKSQPYKDKRFYMLAGLKYGYDVASNKESKQEVVKFSPHDFQWEIGMGAQFFYPYFIFSPEIKFSRGLTNNLIYDNQITEAKVLKDIFSQVITISFNFEG